jgi:hemoglobin-like flavoprotein
MQQAQIEAVRISFQVVESNADTFADLFFARLFALAPEARDLFTHDLRAQKQKLLAMLRVIVEGLGQMELLLPILRDLGTRHNAYGVTAQHYDVVATVLEWTLDVTLAEAFTPAVHSAWQGLYAAVAQAMQAETNAVGVCEPSRVATTLPGDKPSAQL